MEHKIELLTGFTDKDGNVHRDVTFGRRVTCGDLMIMQSDPRAGNATQYNDLILRRMITKFGELMETGPVDTTVLLSLDSIDRDDLQRAGHEFNRLTGGSDAELVSESVVRLATGLGFKIDDVEYVFVTFGRITTGQDSADADALNLPEIGKECCMLGRTITRIETADKTASIDGMVDLKTFNDLDGLESLSLLKVGAASFRSNFRAERAAISRKRDGKAGVSDDAGNGDVGDGSDAAAGGPA